MRRSHALYLLPLLVASGAIFTWGVGCPDCLDRARDNPRCDWIADTTFTLDARNPSHRRHLVLDAQLAEEVAIRYADAEHRRRYGYEGHGGLIDRGALRRACMARLVAHIERNHGVTVQQIQDARGHRSLAFDLMAALLFLPLYWLGATLVADGLNRRFSSDERHVRLVAMGVASMALAFLAVQVFELWLSVWEVIRVGNGHISGFRATTYHHWARQHLIALYIGSLAGFWFAAWQGSRLPRMATIGSAAVACAILAAQLFERSGVVR